MTAKRGRPVLAAQSLDAALEAHFKGKSPKRPRNEFERQVMRKTRGRKADATSPTQQAALLAVYLIQTEGISKQAAAKQAGAAFGVHAATVRRYVRASLNGPQVSLTQKKATWWGQGAPIIQPLVVPDSVAQEAFGNCSINGMGDHPIAYQEPD